MKIQLMSDLHFEFHADKGKSFVESLDPKDVDVLVLAGDIATFSLIPDALNWFCDKYFDVIYVHGNHEFYGSNREDVVKLMKELDFPNLHWLDCSEVTIKGKRFLGAPMWFKYDHYAPRHCINDFYQIKGFSNWVYSENQKALNFFDTINKGDIVVSHYLPAPQSVHPRFHNDPLNSFFLCDVENMIRRLKPKLWCHGHTHYSFRYQIGDTLVACNPFGYVGHGLNHEFDDKWVETVK